MVTKSLIETGAVVSAETEDGLWRVRLINEGRGSSGIYSSDLLESYKSAFDNVVSFVNHPHAGPETRNFTEIAGRVVGEVWTEKADDGTLGIYANWRPDEDYKRKLESYKDRLGLSIYVSGSGEVDDDGEFHVTEFDTEDPFRSVDVVVAAGRGGRFEVSESLREMYDSRRSESNEPTVTSAVGKEKEIKMDELKAAVEALTAQVSALVATEQTAQAEAAQAEADENAGREAVEAYDATVTAIDAADLPASVVESLRKQAKSGADVTALIEQATEMKIALVESASAVEGRVLGGENKGFSLTALAGGK